MSFFSTYTFSAILHKKYDLLYTLFLMDDSSTAISQQAITAALSCNWQEAIDLNEQLLDKDPKNIDAHNRLGRAYFELGNLTKSKKSFDIALEIDPYNQIAAKFITRIEIFRKKGNKKDHLKALTSKLNTQFSSIDGDLFIEEPGKTKLVGLLKIAEPHKLSLLSPGMTVNLIQKNRGVSITDYNGEYLGVLPDDLSSHLLRLIKGGNKYQACIKNTKNNALSILIREVFCSAKFKNQPSFLDHLESTPTYASNNIIIQNEEEEVVFSDDEESN
ncbi:MAG: tetratricopeptide repeat protein [Candidatus Daviesbacteria bacterium]|nr:tetratricopeptide repeat protein [Candidatus Daviesbacteria bacterium]